MKAKYEMEADEKVIQTVNEIIDSGISFSSQEEFETLINIINSGIATELCKTIKELKAQNKEISEDYLINVIKRFNIKRSYYQAAITYSEEIPIIPGYDPEDMLEFFADLILLGDKIHAENSEECNRYQLEHALIEQYERQEEYNELLLHYHEDNSFDNIIRDIVEYEMRKPFKRIQELRETLSQEELDFLTSPQAKIYSKY